MARRFEVGDYVEWRDFYSGGVQYGNIESIDLETGSMCIWTGTFPNAGGGCRTYMSAKRVGRHWLAYRGYKGYKERIRRVFAFRHFRHGRPPARAHNA